MAKKPSDPKKILILTATTGGGHLSIARAIEQLIIHQLPTSKVLKLNTTPKASELFYRYVGNQFSTPLAAIWEWSNSKEKSSLLSQLHYFSAHSLIQKNLAKFAPDLIISTEPFSTFTIQKILKESGQNIPYLIYVADPFSIHHLWANEPHATHYLCQTEEAKSTLVMMGVPEQLVTATGFLVRSIYYQIPAKVHAKKINIFIGGSGEGGGNILKLVRKLTQDKLVCKKIKLVIICGKNYLLKTQISLLPSLKNVSHKIIGYTPHLHTYLGQADFVVGKPGPNILFESIMYQKPFIAIGDPLAQELGNYSYVENEHIGFSAKSIKLAVEKIKFLINNESVIKNITQNIQLIRETQIGSRSKAWHVISTYL